MRIRKEKISQFVLRAGLSFSLFYAGIGGFLEPQNWIGYFPGFLQEYIPGATLLIFWGILEIILGSWILFGKRIFWPSLIAFLALLGVVFFNWGARDVVFLDITIASVALALALKHWRMS